MHACMRLCVDLLAASVLNSELEGWLEGAGESHSPARAIIAPYPQ